MRWILMRLMSLLKSLFVSFFFFIKSNIVFLKHSPKQILISDII